MEFQTMLDEGITHRSSSQWSSLLHMMLNKDGTWRPCGNYHQLNLQTVKDKYPLPKMADLAAHLDGCKLLSKHELRMGYLQVPVAADITKTAIIKPFGLCEFTCMPFGLCNVGMMFQWLMDSVLGRLPFAFVYLAICSTTASLSTSDKCLFSCLTMELLGHHLTAMGIGPLPSTVQAIADFLPTATIKQL
jgi:cleavage and polyadenylation specificity factor subunit 1